MLLGNHQCSQIFSFIITGDHYPLCVDLPAKDHLKKGATYRLNGGFVNPEMQQDHGSWEDNLTLLRLELAPDSPLYAKLCAAQNGVCTWPAKVVLDENLLYDSNTAKGGEEYLVDTIRTLRITLPTSQKYIHYEYIRQPCVDQFFLGSNAKKVIRGNISNEVVAQSVCADPRRAIATELCCELGWETSTKTSDQFASRFCFYHGERMIYSSAENRCAANGKDQCTPRGYYNSICNFDVNREMWSSWTASSCMTRAKISFDTGFIGRVDHPDADYAGFRNVASIVDENQKNFVKVAWLENPVLPKTASDCNIISSCYSVTDGCICDTSVSDSTVFANSSEILSQDEIHTKLFIASFEPDLFDDGTINDLGNCGIQDVQIYSKSFSDSCSNFSADTFFGFKDNHGVQRYLKNVISTVTILGINKAEFRNIPHFIDMVDHDLRDMYHETDAGKSMQLSVKEGIFIAF